VRLGERYGSSTWYEPVSSFGTRLVTDHEPVATAYGLQEQALGQWVIAPNTADIWGIVANDYMLGQLVVTETSLNTDWQCRFPMVMSAKLPEPGAFVALAIAAVLRPRAVRPLPSGAAGSRHSGPVDL